MGIIDKKTISVIKDTLHAIVPELKNAKTAEEIAKVKINDKQIKQIYDVLGQDAIEAIEKLGLAKLPPAKSFVDVTRHFFSWNKNWSLGRCILGAFMVHAPEYPTYLIPAFTQAKASGSAGELKKGEGFRGVITGCLEGIAVGALVSGERLKMKEMIPFIALGAGLQFFSSKFFPWLGERWGKKIYKTNLKERMQAIKEANKNPITKPEEKTLDLTSPTTTVNNIANVPVSVTNTQTLQNTPKPLNVQNPTTVAGNMKI